MPKHFLTKLVQGNIDSDVHRRMVKYSKGIFPGPRLNAAFRGKTLRLHGDFEYESLVGSFFLWNMEVRSFKVDGKVICRENRSKTLNDLGVESTMKKSKRLYEVQLKQINVDSDSLREMYLALDECFLLLSLTPLSGKGQLKTKTRIPKPSLEESEKKPSFCSAVIPVSDANDILGKLVHLAAPDFGEEVAIPFSTLDLKNYYEISEIALPETGDKLSTGEIRLKALRKGSVRRNLEIDGRAIEKAFSFTA
ncbi:MAG: hypothetical protein ACFE7E_04075 [Candidatus Hodarchaeota archaeon]